MNNATFGKSGKTTSVEKPPSPPLPLSGKQYEIAYGDQRAVITQVGATLRSYDVSGAPVIDGFSENEICQSAKGQILAPWPNRLRDGKYIFGNKSGTAAIDEPERHNAIHGLLRYYLWDLVTATQNYCRLQCHLAPQPAYPWWLEIQIEYRLTKSGLSVEVVASTPGEETAPFGIGFHPYLSTGRHDLDGCRIMVPASVVLPVDDRMIPEGQHDVTGSQYDLRTPTLIGDMSLDTAYTGLQRDADGMVRVKFEPVGAERQVTLWMDSSFKYVQVFTADTLPNKSERRRMIALEPMTCPANALQTHADIIELEPGKDFHARWGISMALGDTASQYRNTEHHKN